MRKIFLFLFSILVPMIVLAQGLKQAEQTDDIRLIDPVFDGEILTPSEVLKLRSEANYNNWGIQLLGFDQVIGTGEKRYSGKGISFCTCDTGLPDHEAYNYKIPKDGSANFTSESSVEDVFGHATHVAGIMHEIAPDADLYFAKVLNNAGSGSYAGIVNGIDWCISKMKPGKGVINMSLGGPTDVAILKEAVNRANAAGIVVVCAAGNSGSGEKDNIGYPGGYENVISVGSINKNKLVSYFSSSGPQGDIVAPGERILSTYLGNTYEEKSGTSMSAPFVTGLVGLYLEYRGNSGNIEKIFEDLAIDIPPAGFDRYSFNGYNDVSLFNSDPGQDPDPVPIPDDKNWFQRNLFVISLILGAIVLFLVIFFLIKNQRSKIKGL